MKSNLKEIGMELLEEKAEWLGSCRIMLYNNHYMNDS